MKKITLLFTLLTISLGYSQTDIAVNGGFETNDFTGWTQFTNGTQGITDINPSEGTYCAELNNNVPASASLIKNANVGIGTAVGDQEVTITFDARGTTADGGVAFAELFSEIDGGGVSKSEILGGGPLALDPDSNVWKNFSFTTTLGSDVSGGVTLQLSATTGGAGTSSAHLFYDNVKITLTDQGPSARVQVIHNSADLGASVVDVYLDGVLTLDDFAFRTASPFINVPAETPISVAIAPSNSTSVGDAIATFPYNLTDGETYILVAEGIVSPSGYTPATPFDIAVYPMGQEAAATSGNTDLLVHHGSTDAPTVDVNEVSGPSVLVDNISYGEFDANGYLELPTADYSINISTADGVTVVESYDAPLATLGLDDTAAVVVASGFLDPSVNSNGPAFGLWVALPSGGALVELPITGAATGNNVTVDVNATWLGYVNAFNTPADGGAYVTGFAKPVAELKTTIGADDITLQPNFLLYNASDPFWSNGAIGNKIVECTTFVEPGASFNGNNLTFSGQVDSYTLGNDALGNPYEAKFFIKALDPNAGYSDALNGTKTFDLPASGAFTVSATGAELASGLIVQYGFYIKGLNANPAEEGSLGSVVVSATALSTIDLEEMTFKVYPNPAKDTWNIKTKYAEIKSVALFNTLGKQVMTLKPNSDQVKIDASTLSKGLYFAKIETAAGTSSLKLIKQ
ncbi:T9SS type A sorting domain-containing protein [Aestuariivivens sediminicola]|uniref:T9SS type A sorting domain-containing protein n=1 Tax=Aestuariivivens sediminicola TaxID=2913560 RepID=UPI001F58CBCF|nr:T9SS type A sorting domain-containing protein [Aestuariivivens sediminicola]